MDHNREAFLATIKELFEHPFLSIDAVIEDPFEELFGEKEFDIANGNFVVDLFLFKEMCRLTPAIYYEEGKLCPDVSVVEVVALKDNPIRKLKFSTVHKKFVKFENYPAFRYRFKVVKRCDVSLEPRTRVRGADGSNLVVSLATVKLVDFYDKGLYDLDMDGLIVELKKHSDYFFRLIGNASRYPKWKNDRELVYPSWDVYNRWE